MLSGRQTFIVLQKNSGSFVGCPLVYEGEPVHRADVVLEWHELVDAGLSRLDVRCRSIPCQRSLLSARMIGRIEPEILSRVAVRAGREQTQRNVETLARKGAGPRDRPRHRPVRAVWLEGGMMMSRREASLRAV
ncbi:hypothetical protein [Gluconobacter oxydans]|uniref:hypothetical protein n=1 Tax=Gluconobacter oxydans TaxID=442 RepID=UPI001CD8760C|nr:hypothetical protein [Gluconobacter oxydans]